MKLWDDSRARIFDLVDKVLLAEGVQDSTGGICDPGHRCDVGTRTGQKSSWGKPPHAVQAPAARASCSIEGQASADGT